jgi:FtsP/CotA-like multicopper oxidase with cupredoxin domain
MKHAFVLSAAALSALLISGAALARDAGTGASGTSQDTTQGSGSKSGTAPNTSKDSTYKDSTSDSTSTSKSQSGRTIAAPPAEKPGMLSMPHSVKGSVVSVDKKANSVNVRDNDGKELTLVGGADTAPELVRLKPGDQVKISYKKNKQDQMVATKITMTSATNGAGRSSKVK